MAKIAVRQLVKDEQGVIRVSIVDSETGLPLSNTTGYQIVAPSTDGNLVPLPSTPIEAADTQYFDKILGQTASLPVGSKAGVSSSSPSVPINSGADINPGTSEGVEPEKWWDKSKSTEVSDGFNKDPRTTANNFGYVDKSALLGFTNNIPGPLGTASRLANGMLNSNNAVATNAARQSLGLPGASVAGIAKGAFSDNKGQVADVDINGNTYSVGLEAMTADNRTTLNVNEARQRAALGGKPVTEASPEASALNAKTYGTGVNGGGLLGAAKSVVGGLLGTNKDRNYGTSDPIPTADTASPLAQEQRFTAPTIGVQRQALGPIGSPRSVAPPAPKSAVPSFDSLTEQAGHIPSVDPSKLGSFATETPRDPTRMGLAGITGRVTGKTKNLDSSLGPVLNSMSQVADVGINSGFRDPATNARVGGVKHSQHQLGKAIDVNTSKLSQNQKRDMLEAAVAQPNSVKGVKGVGIGQYDTMMHVDTRENFGTWGYSAGAPVSRTIDQQPSWARDTLQATKDAGPFNPGPRVGPQSVNRADALGLPSDQPTLSASRKGLVDIDGPLNTSPTTTATRGKVSPSYGNYTDFDATTVSNLGSVGAVNRVGLGAPPSEDQLDRMTEAFAGEMGPKGLRGLTSDDPEERAAAYKEAANFASVVDNRVSAVGIDKTFTPENFNSLSPKNQRVTQANLTEFGPQIRDALQVSYTGASPATTPNATHYANLNISAPSWGSKLTDTDVIGEHTFGTVPGEYTSDLSEARKSAIDKGFVNSLSAQAGLGISSRDKKVDGSLRPTDTSFTNSQRGTFGSKVSPTVGGKVSASVSFGGLTPAQETNLADRLGPKGLTSAQEANLSGRLGSLTSTSAQSKAKAGLGIGGIASVSFSGGIVGAKETAQKDKDNAAKKAEADKNTSDSKESKDSKSADSSKSGSGGKSGSSGSSKSTSGGGLASKSASSPSKSTGPSKSSTSASSSKGVGSKSTSGSSKSSSSSGSKSSSSGAKGAEGARS